MRFVIVEDGKMVLVEFSLPPVPADRVLGESEAMIYVSDCRVRFKEHLKVLGIQFLELGFAMDGNVSETHARMDEWVRARKREW